MGSNWAAEFRQRIEESEGKKPTYDVGGALEEEETEVEEPEDEAEEDTAEEIKEPGESEESEKEKPSPKPVVDVGKRAADMFRAMTGQVAPPKPEPQPKPKPKPSSGNPAGAMMTAIMGLLVLQSLPTIFNTVSSVSQPLTASSGTSPQGYPVRCSVCGWAGIGVAGMRCPRCGCN